MRETLEPRLLSIAIMYEETKGFVKDRTSQFTANEIIVMARRCHEKTG